MARTVRVSRVDKTIKSINAKYKDEFERAAMLEAAADQEMIKILKVSSKSAQRIKELEAELAKLKNKTNVTTKIEEVLDKFFPTNNSHDKFRKQLRLSRPWRENLLEIALKESELENKDKEEVDDKLPTKAKFKADGGVKKLSLKELTADVKTSKRIDSAGQTFDYFTLSQIAEATKNKFCKGKISVDELIEAGVIKETDLNLAKKVDGKDMAVKYDKRKLGKGTRRLIAAHKVK